MDGIVYRIEKLIILQSRCQFSELENGIFEGRMRTEKKFRREIRETKSKIDILSCQQVWLYY